MKIFPRLTFVPLLLVAVTVAAESGEGLPKYSPFAQRSAGAAAAGPNENVEFAGVSTVGKKTDLIFYDKVAKKNHWIAKGETKEGISVLNFDEVKEQAVVRINGVEKVLSLRKVTGTPGAPRTVAALPSGFNVAAPAAATPSAVMAADAAAANGAAVFAANNPAPTPAPSAPPAPTTPETAQAKQETEARMLVSDLLEIGMAQRRAYEEAQRKASDGTAANSAVTPPPASPVPTPR